MALADLVLAVKPPSAPNAAGPLDRKADVERALNIALPNEIYELALMYGSGEFGNEIEVLNPFANDYIDKVNMISKCYTELKVAEGDEFIPYDIFPKMPGLYPWGTTSNGHCMFWLCKDHPSSWPLVLLRSGEMLFQELRMDVTTFLENVFTKPTPCVLWEVEWQSTYLLGKGFSPSVNC